MNEKYAILSVLPCTMARMVHLIFPWFNFYFLCSAWITLGARLVGASSTWTCWTSAGRTRVLLWVPRTLRPFTGAHFNYWSRNTTLVSLGKRCDGDAGSHCDVSTISINNFRLDQLDLKLAMALVVGAHCRLCLDLAFNITTCLLCVVDPRLSETSWVCVFLLL